MEQLENKTWWTLEEHRSYFGLKNLLAARRWCHRRGVRIAHGMVNKNEIFNCLSGTANVPRSLLYKCITKNETYETDAQRYFVSPVTSPVGSPRTPDA